MPVARELLQLEPFGAGNPAPQIGVFDATVTEIRAVGVDGKHLKLRVKDSGGTMDCIGFCMGELSTELLLGMQVDLIGELEENEFRGRSAPQLRLKAIRRCDDGKTV